MQIEKSNKGYTDKKVTFIFFDKYSKSNFTSIFKRSKTFIGIDLYNFCKNIEIDFTPSGAELKSTHFDIKKIKESKVFYYPSSFESVYFSPIKGDSSHRFAKRQIASLVDYLEYWLEKNSNLINPPSLGRLWSNKPLQLETFAKFFTEFNIESVIKSNYETVEQNSIIKHLSETRVIDKNNVSLAIKVNDDIKNELLEGLPLPFICQPCIEAKEEFRSYVFGNRVVSVKFDRKCLMQECVDIHQDDNILFNSEFVKLEDNHIELVSMIKNLTNLSVFSFDFFCGEKGQIKMLEINPLGSWYWLPKNISLKVKAELMFYFESFEI